MPPTIVHTKREISSDDSHIGRSALPKVALETLAQIRHSQPHPREESSAPQLQEIIAQFKNFDARELNGNQLAIVINTILEASAGQPTGMTHVSPLGIIQDGTPSFLLNKEIRTAIDKITDRDPQFPEKLALRLVAFKTGEHVIAHAKETRLQDRIVALEAIKNATSDPIIRSITGNQILDLKSELEKCES